LPTKTTLTSPGFFFASPRFDFTETRDAVADGATEEVDGQGEKTEPSLQWIILEQLTNFVSSLA
jgi:hypothetical protein